MKAAATDHLARSRRNQFTAVRLNREVEFRDDAQWVAKTLTDPNTRLVPLWRSRSLLERKTGGTIAVYLSPVELTEPDRIQPPTLLGNDGKHQYFAASVTDMQKDAILAKLPDARFADLRRASIDMAAKHAGILAYAKACTTGNTATRSVVYAAAPTCCVQRVTEWHAAMRNVRANLSHVLIRPSSYW